MIHLDPSLPITELLPLRAVVVTLRFIESCRPRFFHQAALTAFLRYLLDDDSLYDRYIRIDACESGRVEFERGDYYRFLLIALSGGERLLERLMQQLRHLPASAAKTGPELPFRDNWRLHRLQDAFSEEAVSSIEALALYTEETLTQEMALWLEQARFRWRWLTPARLLKEKDQRQGLKGEARYCRDSSDLSPTLLLNRLHDSLADLRRRRGAQTVAVRSAPPALASVDSHLFWLDSHYTDAEGKDQVMGGVAGRLDLDTQGALTAAWWRLLILGQYTGIGQRTTFGWGRYLLSTEEGGFTYRRPLPAASLLMLADTSENLASAWRHVESHSDLAPLADTIAADDEEGPWLLEDAEDEDEAISEDIPLPGLHRNMEQLLTGEYTFPELRGYIRPKKDGGIRPLAVPPFRDRVLQRAVVQVLSPALERLMYERSYGYRRGRSRITASYDIQAAWRAGYRWVYESDIRDFFDSVHLERLRDRLQALYGEDPLVDCIIAWMRAPVRFEGKLIPRHHGLPQGAPLSPLMANLMLDDFDSDMQTAGFHLVRFADDFIVLCKDPEEARRAGAAARASLAEHGLELNPDKTRITAMDQGFRYLGYLFVNDLALDVSGARAPSSDDKAPIPPNSWLVQLADRPPERLGKVDALEQIIRQLAERAPVAVGEREREGTLLCVTGDPCLIVTRNKHLRVLRDDRVLYDLPWISLQTLILFGNHHITTPAMHAALRYQVPVHLVSGLGTYRGVLWNGQPAAYGHRLWVQQIAACNDADKALYMAREIVASRLRHIRETLRLRHKAWDARVLDQSIRAIHRADSLEMLRGFEGRSAREYYLRLAELLPDAFGFDGRNRRPPRDPFNVLLSLGYTLLYGISESIVRAVGFLPWQGFYHQARGSHAALASDLMEPFRHVVERAALTLVLRGEVTPDDFSHSPAGACHITPEARRKYLSLLLQRFETPVKALGATEADKLFVRLYQQALSLRTWITEGEPFKA